MTMMTTLVHRPTVAWCYFKNILFLSITRNEDLVDVYQLRKYDDLDSACLSVINDCSFFKILQMFAVEAGFTLSTLYKMDKIRDVRDQIGNQGKFGAEIAQTYDCYCFIDAHVLFHR